MKTPLTSLRMITIVSTVLLLARTAGFCSQVNTEGKVSVLMIIAVLEIPPVVSAETAVRVQIVKDAKGRG
jgi:hypothetical protein